MEAETFARIWPLLRQAGQAHLQGWGEPLLHPRFLDFAAVARRAGCRVSTTTCGLRMDEELAANIIRVGINLVAFSLAGTDEQSNAARQGAPFDKVCQSVKTLRAARGGKKEARPEIHIAYLLLASQLDALRRLPELLEELDVQAAVVSTMDFIAAPELADEAYLSHQGEKIAEARAVLREVAARATAKGRSVFYSLSVPEPRRDCLENIARSLYIDAEGQVSPCIYVNLPVRDREAAVLGSAPASMGEGLLRRVFGRADEGDLSCVWEDAAYRRFRQGLAGGVPDQNCLECPKRFAVGNRTG